jgi:pimeloyl-ACP methyl ester carboxylesterase
VSVQSLATGAEARFSGPCTGTVVVCVNGGTAREMEGTWSSSVEHLVTNLVPRHPDLGFVEVKYRIRSWKKLEWCIADGRAALHAAVAAGAQTVVLLGYSMGGAVCSQIADHPRVARVVGLAPWLPERLQMDAMRDVEFRVIHGSLDRYLPGIPGVNPASSRAGFERIMRLGGRGTYSLLPGGIHPIALRAFGGLVPMPKAGAWVEWVSRAVTDPAP